MTDRKRIVRHVTFLEDLLVAFARLLGFGEIVEEVGPDERLSINACDFERRFVGVGDLAFGTDDDEGVEAGLDQASAVVGGGAQPLVGQGAFGDVASDGRDSDEVASQIEDGRHREGNRDLFAVFADPEGLVVLDSLASSDLMQDLIHLVRPIRVDED